MQAVGSMFIEGELFWYDNKCIPCFFFLTTCISFCSVLYIVYSKSGRYDPHNCNDYYNVYSGKHR